MLILTGELPPTLTYTSRTWSWIGRIDPAAVPDGTLTVQFTKGKTGRAKVESRRYFVQEIPCDHGGRTFLFAKAEGQPDPNEADIYEVFVGNDGLITCTCKADNCHAPCCVHKDVTPSLIEAGAFDGGEIDPPAEPPVTEAEIDDMAAAFAGEDSGLWFPPEPPADDEDDLPTCFRNIHGTGSRANVPF